jgi:hypothetical protein
MFDPRAKEKEYSRTTGAWSLLSKLKGQIFRRISREGAD